MKKTRCLIVDDEPLAIEVIQAHAANISRLEVVASCHNALEAFDKLNTQDIDLMFLDIQMPMLSGIEFLKSLPQPPKVIFTTAFRDYALDGYELDVVDYLLKPISFDRFFKAINKYFSLTGPAITTPPPIPQQAFKPLLDVKSGKKTYRIQVEDIRFVESMKDYIRIHLPDSRITSKDKLSHFETQLPAHFIRVHRSYLVNLKAITAFNTSEINLGETVISIGVSYKQEVLKALGAD